MCFGKVRKMLEIRLINSKVLDMALIWSWQFVYTTQLQESLPATFRTVTIMCVSTRRRATKEERTTKGSPMEGIPTSHFAIHHPPTNLPAPSWLIFTPPQLTGIRWG